MSIDQKERWITLRDRLLEVHTDVARGRMMSADAITHGGKVFAFFSEKGGRTGLGCRIGRKTDVQALGLTDWQQLSPFKTKPPMKDWIVLGAGDANRWSVIAELSLDLARKRT